MRDLKILSTGVALPSRVVKSEEIDLRQGSVSGQTARLTGVDERYYAAGESASDLAAAAVHSALSSISFPLEKVDCIISASGTMEQAIPYNAARIHSKLGLTRPIPAFDINMTCLSGLMALDLSSNMLMAGQYRHILIVSSEVASVGLDWSDQEVGGLFGDGAAAILVSKSSDDRSGIVASHFATHSEGLDFCQIRGGGSLHHPTKVSGDYQAYGMFEMRGKEAYRLTAKVIDGFVDELIKKTSFSLADIDWVVPHQASMLALEHLRKRLAIDSEKMITILSRRGNQIAASLPSALHELLAEKNPLAGSKVLLIGTSAGLSLGGMVLEL